MKFRRLVWGSAIATVTSLVAVSAVTVLSATTTTAGAAAPQPTSPGRAQAVALNLPMPRVLNPAASASPSAADRASANSARRAASQQAPKLSSALAGLAGLPGVPKTATSAALADSQGDVRVAISGPGAAAAANQHGARINAQANGIISATVPASALQDLATAAGVNAVAPVHAAYAQGGPAQGVAVSGGQNWINAGQSGAGVKIGIVDLGFGGLAGEVNAGRLPAGLKVAGDYSGGGCASDTAIDHGTSVAEVVHQEAPSATLYLYCVGDNVGFAEAEAAAETAGLKIVTSSLGFSAEGRGDGTGINKPGLFVSTGITVKKARQAGILWIQSAGNSAQDHWSGTLADSGGDGYVDLFNGPTDEGVIQADLFALDSGTSADVALTWDSWPSTTTALTLVVDEYASQTALDEDTPIHSYQMTAAPSDESGAPVRDLTVSNSHDTVAHYYKVYIEHTGALPVERFDLSYAGAASPSFLASPQQWGAPATYGSPARAAAGSVMEPASSPYAVAVGAAYWANKSLEPFSSRGPTITGVIKPDILGYDGVSSPSGASDLNEGFYGTSAAAPNVAGAAALLKGANPSWTADQLETFLETRATQGSTNRTGLAPTNAAGYGDLQIGTPPARYTALSAPYRLVDTRIGRGAPKARLGQSGVITVKTAPAGVPASATSVVVNLLGVSAAGATYLSAYPSTFAQTSNVNFAKTDPTAAVGAVVPLSKGTFKVRNYSAKIDVVVDVLGYFSVGGGLRYQPLTKAVRVLDTRTATGGHHRPVVSGEVVRQSIPSTVVPSTADSVIVNLTVTNDRGSGWLAAFTSAYGGTSTLNYGKYARANLAIVKLNKTTSPPSIRLTLKGAPVDVVVDVVGYFSSAAPLSYVAMASPLRIVDSRYGTGIVTGGLTPNHDATVSAAGRNTLPTSAGAILTSVTATGTVLGNITAYDGDQGLPLASNVNYAANRAVSNAAAVPLSAAGQFAVHESTPSPVIVDLFGYFITN